MQAVSKKLNPAKRKHCFELFGLDYMLDSDLNCWLIEANTNPCLEESSKILETLLPRLIDDMFKLTIDKIFPTAFTHAAQAQGRKNDSGPNSNLINTVLR